MGRAAWPKTKAGTIDWEAVFENPDTGLIPLISGAKSANVLRDSTVAVIEMLYAREIDAPEIERFTSKLHNLIPDDTPEDALPHLVARVTAILRQIKGKKIHKAEEYIRQEKSNKRGERRDAATREGKSKEKNRSVSPRIVGGVMVAAVLATIVYFVATGEEEESALRVLIDQMTAVVSGEMVETHAYQGELRIETMDGRVAVSAFNLPPDACSSAAWYFVNHGSVIINGLMPRKISPQILKELCRQNQSGATLTWIPKKDIDGRP